MADAKAPKKAAMKTAKKATKKAMKKAMKSPLKALTRSRRRKLYELVIFERNVQAFDADEDVVKFDWCSVFDQDLKSCKDFPEH